MLDWERLTKCPEKVQLYAQEPYVRNAWADCQAQWGDETNAVIQQLAVVMLKPEAIVRGCLPAVVGFLTDHGLTPIAWRNVELGPSRCTTIWRYQWNKATDDRVALHLFIAKQARWLLVVLRDDEPVPGLPASIRLWGLKGQTDERQRDPSHLRSVIGMKNRMIGFVHTPDEPVDFVREQGILFQTDTRPAWLRELTVNLNATRTRELLKTSTSETDPVSHSVDSAEVIRRLTNAGSARLVQLANAAREGARCSLTEVRAAFADLTNPSVIWDYVILASELIEHDRPSVKATIDSGAFPVVRHAWLQGRPRGRGVTRHPA